MRPRDRLRDQGVIEWVCIESNGDDEFVVTVRAAGETADGTSIGVELDDQADGMEAAISLAADLFRTARERSSPK